jgi:hypothetical protein
MLCDPVNRSNRFLLRLSWSLGLTDAILPALIVYRLQVVVRLLFLVIAIVCLSEKRSYPS